MMPLAMWGVPYTSGLGVQGNSTVQVALNGGYSTFSTVIGLDTQDPSGGAVVYTIVADGKTLYTSPTMTLATGSVGINSLNVAGYRISELIVQVVSGSGNAVDADWGNAQLTPPASTVLLSSVPITVGGNAIKVNTNFQGTPLMLGGIEYAQGIGVATDTKMVISTDGTTRRLRPRSGSTAWLASEATFGSRFSAMGRTSTLCNQLQPPRHQFRSRSISRACSH